MLGYLKRGAQRLGMGAVGPLRGDVTGALVTTDGHARFQEAVLSGNVWHGANVAASGVTLQVGLSATSPVISLYNPINSPVYLAIWHFDIAFTASAAANKMILAYNFPALAGVPTGPTTVTLATVTNAIIGLSQFGSSTAVATSSPWGQCYIVGTLSAAPLAFAYPLGTTGASGISGMSFRTQCDGNIVVPPGVCISVQGTAAATVGLGAFCWEEVPISN